MLPLESRSRAARELLESCSRAATRARLRSRCSPSTSTRCVCCFPPRAAHRTARPRSTTPAPARARPRSTALHEHSSFVPYTSERRAVNNAHSRSLSPRAARASMPTVTATPRRTRASDHAKTRPCTLDQALGQALQHEGHAVAHRRDAHARQGRPHQGRRRAVEKHESHTLPRSPCAQAQCTTHASACVLHVHVKVTCEGSGANGARAATPRAAAPKGPRGAKRAARQQRGCMTGELAHVDVCVAHACAIGGCAIVARCVDAVRTASEPRGVWSAAGSPATGVSVFRRLVWYLARIPNDLLLATLLAAFESY